MPSTAGTSVVLACVKYHQAPKAAAASSARIASTSPIWLPRLLRRRSSLTVSRSIVPSSRCRTTSFSRTTACSTSGSPSGGATGSPGPLISTRSSVVVVSERTRSSRSSRISLPFSCVDAATWRRGRWGIPRPEDRQTDAACGDGYSNQTSVARTTYRLTSARPSNSTAFAVAGHLPERDRGQRERAEVDRLDDEREALGEEQREDDEDGPEEAGDLRHRVLHDGDREVVLALPGELDGDDVLDGVAGDRDDHEPGERLRDADRLDRRVERVRRTSRRRTRPRRPTTASSTIASWNGSAPCFGSTSAASEVLSERR